MIFEVNSDNRTDQLDEFRFKMESGNPNLSSPKSEKIPENGMHGGRGRKSQRGKPTINTATRPGKLKLGDWGRRGFYTAPFRGPRMGSMIEGRFAYAIK